MILGQDGKVSLLPIYPARPVFGIRQNKTHGLEADPWASAEAKLP